MISTSLIADNQKKYIYKTKFKSLNVGTTEINIQDNIDEICKQQRTFVICDEHHHAAVEAAWGESANSAFKNAKYCLILTGTPFRTDGKDCTWFSKEATNDN